MSRVVELEGRPRAGVFVGGDPAPGESVSRAVRKEYTVPGVHRRDLGVVRKERKDEVRAERAALKALQGVRVAVRNAVQVPGGPGSTRAASIIPAGSAALEVEHHRVGNPGEVHEELVGASVRTSGAFGLVLHPLTDGRRRELGSSVHATCVAGACVRHRRPSIGRKVQHPRVDARRGRPPVDLVAAVYRNERAHQNARADAPRSAQSPRRSLRGRLVDQPRCSHAFTSFPIASTVSPKWV